MYQLRPQLRHAQLRLPGYTIETPYNNEASTDLFEYGVYGLIDYVMEHKDDIYHNQLEFFRRGIENEDHRDSMEKWYVDVNNKQLQSDTWRVPYEENDNYFPEYYVIPVDAASQRDPADAYEMGRFLLRNGVRVSMLDTDTAVGGVTYRAGSWWWTCISQAELRQRRPVGGRRRLRLRLPRSVLRVGYQLPRHARL